jgi:teichuronic acid biosynthesis glycosyltransferase TuaC
MLSMIREDTADGGARTSLSLPNAAAPSVLVVTNMYPTPEEPWFGCFVRDQVDDLVTLGIDVNVVDFDGRSSRLNYLRAAREVRRLVARGQFDLVHAHYGLAGAAAVFQHRLPTVTTFHGSDYNVSWQRRVSWVVARRCTPVFVSGQGSVRLGLPSAPVVPAGVDTALFRPQDRVAARRSLGWPEDAHYVLFPGRRTASAKRADLFDAAVIHARALVPDLCPIAFEGYTREDAATVMNAVDVVLMTSDREGSPLAVRESLACMTPVVSVDVGDVRKALNGLPGCAIVARDPQALASGVIQALAAPRSRALRRRAQLHSRRRVAERLVALYTGLVGGRR